MMDFDIDRFFKSLPAFQNAPPRELSHLATRCKRLELPKGGYIFQEGEPAHASWWVVRGIVKISKLAPSGRMSTMEILMAGDIFAPAGVMNIPFYPANAVAVTEAAVLKAPQPDMAQFARAFPQIAGNVLQQVSERLQRAHRLRVQDAASSEKKVAAALLWLSEKTGPAQGVSRRELADIAGVAPETAVRVILELRQKKWVRATPRSVAASDAAALKRFVEQD